MSESFYCYETSTKDNADYFIYWQPEQNILGVTNLNDNVFEIKLDRKDRKKMLRNVAESLVENKWRNAFLTKALKLRNISDESAELFYVVESVEIPRINDLNLCKIKNLLLFKNALQQINILSKRSSVNTVSNKIDKNLQGLECKSPQKNYQKTNNLVKEASALRRKRHSATGIVFSDNEN